MKSIISKNNLGFTFIETLVVVAIGALLLSVVLFSLSSLKNSSSLGKTAVETKSFLEEARSLSISEKSDVAYTVQIQSDRLVMSAGATTYRTLMLDSNSSIGNISLNGGGNQIVFKKMTGATNNFGSFVVTVNGNPKASTTISVSSTGIVSQNP